MHAPFDELQDRHDVEHAWQAKYPGEYVFSGHAVQFKPDGVYPEKQLVQVPLVDMQLVQLEQVWHEVPVPSMLN